MLASELNNKMKIKINGKGHFLKIKMVWNQFDHVIVQTSKGSHWFKKDETVVTDTPSEVMVERVNLMTGKKFMELRDTPRCCSPSSEAYWSM